MDQNGLSSVDAELLLDQLRACAWAPSATPDENQALNHHYQLAVGVLKASNMWTNNQWLTGTWLTKPEVSFQYGTEALNKVLKYKYLPKQKHMTLSHVISSITSEFLPALHYKYVFKNFKQTDLYRSYNPSVVPCYLQGHPKQTILHCLHRKASSNKFTPSDVSQVSPNCGKFEVKGSKGKHDVDFGSNSSEPHCSRLDFTPSAMQALLCSVQVFF